MPNSLTLPFVCESVSRANQFIPLIESNCNRISCVALALELVFPLVVRSANLTEPKTVGKWPARQLKRRSQTDRLQQSIETACTSTKLALLIGKTVGKTSLEVRSVFYFHKEQLPIGGRTGASDKYTTLIIFAKSICCMSFHLNFGDALPRRRTRAKQVAAETPLSLSHS